MRFANYEGRATIVVTETTGVDVETVSNGKFGPDPAEVLGHWEVFVDWARNADLTGPTVAIDRSRLGPPSPEPTQVFAIGLNYSEHAAESGFEVPDRLPPVFTKFQSSLTGPYTTVALPAGGNTDWEVELVAIIGRVTRAVSEVEAWSCVAGLSVGQDISERVSQLAGPAPQFSLGKSFPGFSPFGPWLVTPDEFANPDDLEIACEIDGEEVQRGRTSELIFNVPQLISILSRQVTLYPGDLIFTGTPAGVGVGRDPQRFLKPGETLHSWIPGIGEIKQTFVATT
ncbi:fumarylacetoacetate hydrolase family protein [Mycolicibacterium stellerae]|uniref:fumarylacetoacetate hydrolase family protein n=1 Tax=Mycolicibacterium stellerae TaxID=2358193 RepID=UPI000F0BD0BA|nr:fumarylacetoacetate hydrolase family protein [Mycolicibacterium stellerae]